MVTKDEILRKTGISPRSLARLQEQGIIPRPELRPHPRGRGRLGYYPDDVLDRVKKIEELKRQGHSIYSAAAIAKNQQSQESVNHLDYALDGEEELLKIPTRWIKLHDGNKVDLHIGFLKQLNEAFEKLLPEGDLRNTVLSRVGSSKVFDHALGFLSGGINPVLVYSGNAAYVMPDFMLIQNLSRLSSETGCFLAVQLLPVIRDTYRELGLASNPQIGIKPTMKVEVYEDGNVLEREVLPNGPFGFTLKTPEKEKEEKNGE